MAVARTRTVTRTFTRVDLMVVQVSVMLARCRVDPGSIEKITRGINRKWIEEISIYGVDASNTCWAELFARIDWARNRVHVEAGRSVVEIDARWHQDVAVEVEKSGDLFEKYCTTYGLKVTCHTRYRAGVDQGAANAELGMVIAQPVVWAGGAVGTAMSIPELDEFTVGVSMVER